MKVKMVKKILEANDRIAAGNRALLANHKVEAVNLMSAPGAGKTTLLEKTIRALDGRVRIGVIEGDIQGTHDAEVISGLDVPVVQINTGGACHLDANMISDMLQEMPLDELDLLVIENVGNLVCPAEFDVGESAKIMLLSITEGDDKPLKYPLMFQKSEVLILNKIDLAPYLDVDMEKIRSDAKKLNPDLKIFDLSARNGQGMEDWCRWLEDKVKSR
ncbi:MAG: hydrogenase nickel incorporation protein HypB [Deltaproteobacteria bacterium]|nr:hydrogenase nickel incorporation protein HypB [Deltaproteobacteria bacterium]